jgi:hypothetical protein
MDYITRLMANARMHLTGAVDDAIKVELFNAVDEFCRETDMWTEDIVFPTVAGTEMVYDLVPTLGTILRLVDLRRVEGNMPVHGHMRIPGELILPFAFEADTQIRATVSLAPLDPTQTATDFPEIDAWLWDRHFNTFVHGVIYKMASQPDKTYSDTELVAFHGQKFRNHIGIARADNIRANTTDGQAWRFPDFAVQRNSSRQVN